MIEVRPFEKLGRFENGWLRARYHFSFAGYHDPARRGVGPLLVWNDDNIRAGTGFERHGHRDMEIITYVRRGAITHEDHLGNRGRTEAGDGSRHLRPVKLTVGRDGNRRPGTPIPDKCPRLRVRPYRSARAGHMKHHAASANAPYHARGGRGRDSR